MEVWIEQVLFDNLIINCLILFSTAKLLKLKTTKFKIFASSLMGSVFALLMPLIVLPTILFVLLKLIVGLIMILMLQNKKNNLKTIFLQFLTFLMTTFLFGGVCYGIITIINVQFFGINNAIFYNYDFPISIIVLICFLTFYLLIKIFAQFYKIKSVNNFVYNINFIYKSKTISATAFFDSGNKLMDVQTQKPIIIVSLNLCQKIFEEVNLINLITGKIDNIRFKEISTTGKKQKLLIKDVEKVEILMGDKKNIFNNVPLGILLKNFQDCIDYDCLIGADYII